MLRYILRSLIDRIPVFFGITIISFVILHLPPGEPTDLQTQMNPKATAEVRERIREFYGLDRPLHVQYVDWLGKLMKGDLGRSFSMDHRPVIDKISERLPITITISLIQLILIFLISIPFGLALALIPRFSLTRWFQGLKNLGKSGGSLAAAGMAVPRFVFNFLVRLGNAFSLLCYATPSFALALYLIIIFGMQLSLLPISGIQSVFHSHLSPSARLIDYAGHLILPVSALVLHSLASSSWILRNRFLSEYSQDYVATARSKGLSERKVIVHHTLRNALLPYITLLGLSLPGLIGGSVIIEMIFAIPGMGLLLYQSIMARDYPVVMGILVIASILTLLGNFLADLGYALADPRIRTR